MKFYIGTIIFAATICGLLHHGDGNPIDDLIRSALEAVRKLLKQSEPYPVPDMPEQTVSGGGMMLHAKFSNVKVSKASDFTIDHIENNLIPLWAKFAATVPTMHLEGDYRIDGTVNGRTVKGQGTFTLDINRLVTNGYTELEIVSNYIQMKKLEIDYTIQDLKFTEQGLSVEGLSQDELQAMLSDSFLKYFQQNEQFVSSQVSQYVLGQVNTFMYGKTLQQILDWLKKFIDQVY